MFKSLYAYVLKLSGHRHAQYVLGIYSFLESIIVPIPTDVILLPMVLRTPNRAIYLIALAVITSVIGGLVGYALGAYAMVWVAPWLQYFGQWDTYVQMQHYLEDLQFWAIIIGALTPLPYKLFTIAAGAFGWSLWLFIIASIIGRTMRFGLVGLLARFLKTETVEVWVHKHIERLGWVVVLMFALYIVYKL